MNTPSTSCEIIQFNYEQIIQDIAFKKPKYIKSRGIQGLYYKGDPACEIILENGNMITLRIWRKHMLENTTLQQDGNIFISAYISKQKGVKAHLPLYGWYKLDDYTVIWNEILKN